MNEYGLSSDQEPTFTQADSLPDRRVEVDPLETRVIEGDLRQLKAMAKEYDSIASGPRPIDTVALDGLAEKWKLSIAEDLDQRQKLAAVQAALTARLQLGS